MNGLEGRVARLEDELGDSHPGCALCRVDAQGGVTFEWHNNRADTVFGPDAKLGDRVAVPCEGCGREVEQILICWPDD